MDRSGDGGGVRVSVETELGVAGNAAGIALPNGSHGGLAASLVVNVDLSGKG